MESRPAITALLVFTMNHDKSNPSPSIREWSSAILKCLNKGESNSHSNHSALLYTSDDHRVLTYSLMANEEIPILKEKLKGADFGTSNNWRLYESLPANLETLASFPGSILTPHILVLNGMTPAPELEEDFNEWYAEEHIPLLSRVPGWIYSRRYRLVATEAEHGAYAPQYLAIHAWETDLAFYTAPYKLAVSTPWRMSVVGKVVARERLVVEFVEDVLDPAC